MVMKAEPLMRAVSEIRETRGTPDSVVSLSPQGRTFTQAEAERLGRLEHIVLLCGRYEGMDERVRDMVATEEISIGDHVSHPLVPSPRSDRTTARCARRDPDARLLPA